MCREGRWDRRPSRDSRARWLAAGRTGERRVSRRSRVSSLLARGCLERKLARITRGCSSPRQRRLTAHTRTHKRTERRARASPRAPSASTAISMCGRWRDARMPSLTESPARLGSARGIAASVETRLTRPASRRARVSRPAAVGGSTAAAAPVPALYTVRSFFHSAKHAPAAPQIPTKKNSRTTTRYRSSSCKHPRPGSRRDPAILIHGSPRHKAGTHRESRRSADWISRRSLSCARIVANETRVSLRID